MLGFADEARSTQPTCSTNLIACNRSEPARPTGTTQVGLTPLFFAQANRPATGVGLR
jgi:hypothetical protein